MRISPCASPPWDPAALLRGFGDLVLQVAGHMITAELAQRCLVQLKQNLAELLGVRIAGCETLAVHFALCANEGVSVLGADFSVLVAVAIVESSLNHGALHCTRSIHRGDQIATTPARELHFCTA